MVIVLMVFPPTVFVATETFLAELDSADSDSWDADSEAEAEVEPEAEEEDHEDFEAEPEAEAEEEDPEADASIASIDDPSIEAPEAEPEAEEEDTSKDVVELVGTGLIPATLLTDSIMLPPVAEWPSVTTAAVAEASSYAAPALTSRATENAYNMC